MGALRALCLSLSLAGAKSFSYINDRLQRYAEALFWFANEMGTEYAEAVLDFMELIWCECRQRFLQIFERLQTMHIVSPTEILSWCIHHLSLISDKRSHVYWTMYQALNQCVSISIEYKICLEE